MWSPRRSDGLHAQAPVPFERAAMIARLRDEAFDVLVVGGGITGAGTALDAASRGLRTALVEREDFASGTSSKSSKLVHGGLRYLQQGEVRLVYEALHERQRLRRNARHLVHVLPFMIPILSKPGPGQARSVVSRRVARALGSAMWMYDVTGGWRIGRVHRRLRRATAFEHLPTMERERLVGAYLYFDAQADDARLVVAAARTAAAHGAVVVNRCPVVEISHDAAGRADGAVVAVDGERIRVRARAIDNATGVWADELRELDEAHNPGSLRPAKGVHVTVPWEKVRNDIAVVIPVPKDKRSLFLVPWGRRPDGTFEHTYVGTTDTDYVGSLDDPRCTREDIEYVLRALDASLTTGITADDVTGTWAGLRPLVRTSADPSAAGRTADLSRRHRVTTSPSGVITITGGKLTTYRQMAEDAVDLVATQLGGDAKCRTKRLPFVGSPRTGRRASSGHLGERFGTEVAAIDALIAADPSLAEPLVPGLPYLRAEAIHAVRAEMALTLDDVLSRRTRARLLDRAATAAAAPSVAALVAPELGWDDADIAHQVERFVASCAADVDAERASPAERAHLLGGTA